MADTEEKEITIKNFLGKIMEQKGLEPIWEKVLDLICVTCNLAQEDKILKFFCIYFSLLDDGNTCVCLDEKEFLQDWITKWKGLLLVSEIIQSPEEQKSEEKYFSDIIKFGINNITNKEYEAIISSNENDNKLFILKEIKGKKWLFTSKFYKAKTRIEERVKVIFSNTEKKPSTEAELNDVIDFFAKRTITTLPPYHVHLEEEQAKVIVSGMKSNLIVTGGPGTGKTTAVCYLLWKLFEQADGNGISYKDYKLYLVAPTAKAAARMKESISDSLNDFKPEVKDLPENAEIVEKLAAAESFTVHRLLNYKPYENSFHYNKDHQFDKKTIFIIDEASMIDIILFQNLLEAIPEESKVFILGDNEQLPSVQAGAVLEELIKKREASLVSLKNSKRFNPSSEVGRLKNEMQVDRPFPAEKSAWKEYGTWLEDYAAFQFNRTKKQDRTENPVFFYSFKEVKNIHKDETKKEQMIGILKKWEKAFCEDLVEKANFENKNVDIKSFEELWKLVNEAKILCAERRSFRGVEDINTNVSKLVCKVKLIEPDEDGYFVGQPLILTQNQKMFRLYNGDTGIVVTFGDSKTKYLMVEKKVSEGEETEKTVNEQDLFFRRGDFMFYTLSMLPNSAIETAYAITIHKSQGSGYPNIMVVLPEQVGHPLLNRQIVYTAITRTSFSTYIIAEPDALNYAKKTVIVRHTMLE